MGFEYAYVRLQPDKQIGLHSNDTWELDCIIKGRGSRTIGNNTEPFVEGEVVLIPPKTPHQWRFDMDYGDNGGNIINITLIFSPDILDPLIAAFPFLEDDIAVIRNRTEAVSFTGETKNAIRKLLEDMRFQSPADRAASFIRMIPFMSGESSGLGKYIKPDPAAQRVTKVRLYVSCNFSQHISVDEIAGYVGMNSSSFCVFFKKHTGKTFIEYLNSYRLDVACRLLQAGQMNMSEVCTEVGFADYPYFSRVFKKRFGVAPSEWARQEKHA